MQEDIFKKIYGLSESDVDIDSLKKVTDKYPYFPAAHLYQLKGTAQGEEYDKTAARTNLHFNDPFLLTFLLNKKNEQDVVSEIETVPAKSVDAVQKNSEEAELVFEPLYTTDYFASQGIKLSEEVKPDDRLGKQLKSFTDWLKTMKKVHDPKNPTSDPVDLTVQTIAEKSNLEEEVITESMAEAYISQGKLLKAREIYRKLSLLNPAKSAFFAAKSESLKEK